ncbi:MAG TPA: hypothetical protein VFB96_05470 [Pirellulaceae bacterium]|nr:hypothetical protein [Pirellulaceae bacterium]
MNFLRIIWDLDDDEEGNIRHILEHGVSVAEVEEVLRTAPQEAFSRSSGRPLVFGHTAAGRLLVVVFEQVDQDTIYPITAYEPEES